jgi:VWFA-related protein
MPSRTTRGLFCGLGITGLAVMLAAQQAPPSQPTFRASTTLAQVEVVVVDAAGDPVHGLTKDNFTLVEGETNRPIVGFEEFSRGGDFSLPFFPPSFKLDVADNAAARMDRIVMLVLDDLHAFRERDNTVKRLARSIVNDLGPSASMGFTTTSGNQRTELTTDRSKVLALIDVFEGRKKTRRPDGSGGPSGLATAPRDYRPPGRPGGDAAEALSEGPAGPPDLAAYFASVTTSRLLADAARALRLETGRRRTLIYVSEGTALQPAGEWGETITALRRSGVAVYTIDPRGSVPRGSPLMFVECSGDTRCMRESWQRTWVEDAQRDLAGLAQSTGGLAIVNTDELDRGVTRVVEDVENYYVLGFNPLDVGTNVDLPIHIQTTRPGLTLRYRHLFENAPAATSRPGVNPLFGLSAGILPKSELPLRAYAVALSSNGKNGRVAFWLEVRGDALAMHDADGALRDTLQYAIVPVEIPRGKVQKGIAKVGHVVLRPTSTSGSAPHRVVYGVDAILDVKPGSYQFRLSATSLRLQKSGSVYLSLDVPDFDARLALSGLVIGYEGRPRVPFAYSATQNASLPFQATLDRVFDRDERLQLLCDVSRSAASTSASATVEVINEAGVAVQSLHPALSNRRIDRIDVPLVLSELSPGPYRLRVRVSDGTSTATREISFQVSGRTD